MQDNNGRLGVRWVAVYADRQMAEMEGVFKGAGDRTRQADALDTIRRWELDPMLNSASRQRARALVWKLQSNGWDEV